MLKIAMRWLGQSLSGHVSTNTGTDVQTHEIFFTNTEELQDQFTQIRSNLGVPTLVRSKGDYAHPLTTPHFCALSFPQLYPFGVGDETFINTSKIVSIALKLEVPEIFRKFHPIFLQDIITRTKRARILLS
jgi:hypothetical protein